MFPLMEYHGFDILVYFPRLFIICNFESDLCKEIYICDCLSFFHRKFVSVNYLRSLTAYIDGFLCLFFLFL